LSVEPGHPFDCGRIDASTAVPLPEPDTASIVATGATPDSPVLVQLNLSGPAPGKLVVNGGLPQCDQVAYLHYQAEAGPKHLSRRGAAAQHLGRRPRTAS